MSERRGRRPVEAIQSRNRRTAECELQVRKALTKLVKTGLPFTVEDVCLRAGVGKTFIYDKRHPDLTRSVLEARDVSQHAASRKAADSQDAEVESWRTRALNAEAHIKQLRTTIRERDGQISDLMGQIFDPEGTHLADENARLRGQIDQLNRLLTRKQSEISTTQRSLEASRSTVKRERSRNLAALDPPLGRFNTNV